MSVVQIYLSLMKNILRFFNLLPKLVYLFYIIIFIRNVSYLLTATLLLFNILEDPITLVELN